MVKNNKKKHEKIGKKLTYKNQLPTITRKKNEKSI